MAENPGIEGKLQRLARVTLQPESGQGRLQASEVIAETEAHTQETRTGVVDVEGGAGSCDIESVDLGRGVIGLRVADQNRSGRLADA